MLACTTSGDIRAGAAVVAANAWLGQIVPALSGRVTPVRGQALAFAQRRRCLGQLLAQAATALEQPAERIPFRFDRPTL